MSTFRFDDEYKELDIEGHMFRVAVGEIATLNAWQVAAERVVKMREPAQGGSYALIELRDEIASLVDGALGAGSFDLIVGDRKPTATGLISLMRYLYDELIVGLNESVNAKLSDLTVTVPED